MVTIEELNSVLYQYQIDQITDEDDDITQEAIDSAEMLVRGYLNSANLRRETANLNPQQYQAWQLYNVDAMFAQTGEARNALLMRIIKRIAAYNIIELSNPDAMSDKIVDSYNNSIDLLNRIAGSGDYAQSRFIIPGAIFINNGSNPNNPGASEKLPFRMVSRPKFRHEPL